MMITPSNSDSYVTYNDLMKFPFAYKLWLVVNLDIYEFIRWNRDGTVILIDILPLEKYLSSEASIFFIKNRSVFLQHLEEFNFERLDTLPEVADLILQYKHEYFQRYRLDLLANIRRNPYQPAVNSFDDSTLSDSNDNESDTTTSSTMGMGEVPDDCKFYTQHVRERMSGDLCFMNHGILSNIEKKRLHFQTVLNFERETRLLKKKLQETEQHVSAGRDGSIRRGPKSEAALAAAAISTPDMEQIVEMSLEMYENPHDSMLNSADGVRKEYAGFYGHSCAEQVINFFGDYLPMHTAGSINVKKFVTGSANSQQWDNASGDVNDDNFDMPSTSTPLGTERPFNFDFSPTLQSLYNRQNNNAVGNSNLCKTSIWSNSSMEEFISINKASNNAARNTVARTMRTVRHESWNKQAISFSNGSEYDMMPSTSMHAAAVSTATSTDTDNTSGFPQMPTSMQMELMEQEDMQVNETNFRNFFSQYRASVKLLYERQ